MNTISLCMICKNEERFIAQCLESVHPYVDQIIVCDTGSTDRTVEIAKSFPKVTVSYFPWNGSFADARNASLKGATGDWIIFLDADEVLAKESGERLKETLRLLDKNGISASFIEIYNAKDHVAPEKVLSGEYLLGNSSIVPRLFKNTPEIYFEGAIHENFGDSVIKARRKLGQVDLRIVHYGAMKSVRQDRNKIERNVIALCNAIADDPQSPVAYGYLSQELYEHSDMFPRDVAEQVCEEGWKLVQSANYRTSVVRIAIIRSTWQKEHEDYRGMIETLEKCMLTEGPTADLDFLMGLAYFDLSQTVETSSNEQLLYMLEAEQYFKFAMVNPIKASFVLGSGSFQALNQIGWLKFAFAEFDEAKECWEQVLKMEPNHESAKKGLSHLVAGNTIDE